MEDSFDLRAEWDNNNLRQRFLRLPCILTAGLESLNYQGIREISKGLENPTSGRKDEDKITLEMCCNHHYDSFNEVKAHLIENIDMKNDIPLKKYLDDIEIYIL